jgi:hypothetical protein
MINQMGMGSTSGWMGSSMKGAGKMENSLVKGSKRCLMALFSTVFGIMGCLKAKENVNFLTIQFMRVCGSKVSKTVKELKS